MYRSANNDIVSLDSWSPKLSPGDCTGCPLERCTPQARRGLAGVPGRLTAPESPWASGLMAVSGSWAQVVPHSNLHSCLDGRSACCIVLDRSKVGCLSCIVHALPFLPPGADSLIVFHSGAFGAVYKARLDDVQPVAVKMLNADKNFRQSDVSALMNEVRQNLTYHARH